MKNILILINDYLPIKSADSKILSNIVEELKNDYFVYIVSASDLKQKKAEQEIEIYGVCNNAYLDLRILNSIKNIRINSLIKSLYICIVKNIFRLFKFFISPDLSILYAYRIYKKSRELIISNEIKTILSVSGSFTNPLVGYFLKLRFKDIKWHTMLYDPLPNDNFIYKDSVNFVYKSILTSLILNNSESILLPELLYKYYNQKYKKNFIKIGFPLIKENHVDNQHSFDFNDNFINLVYLGSLNLKVRNPEYWFFLISKSKFINNIRIYIPGNNAIMTLIKKYNLEGNFIKVDYLSKDQITEMFNFNKNIILINIGNRNELQLPSKVFEYISSGLPIISFEQNNNENVLYKYDSSLIINEQCNFNRNLNKFDSFIIKKHKRVSFTRISEEYIEHTPKYCSNIVKSAIERNIYDVN